MANLIKFEVVELPKLYLIGKELRYSMELHMKGDNRIGAFWDKCFEENIFATLEKQEQVLFDKAYVGVMIDWDKGDGDFSYICGMLFNEGASVPDGYVMKELDATKAGVSWIQGKNVEDVCMNAHKLTEEAVKENGGNFDNYSWCMELYNCPRFTNPDENGDIILDYYIPVK